MNNNYNYLEAVTADVKEWIENNMDLINDIYNGTFEDREDIETYLNDTLWTEDSVTGNASGSYTFSTYEAESNLCHNLELIEEVAAEFGCDPVIKAGYEYGPEWWDVSIRCYYLGQAITAALDEIDGAITEAIRDREAEKENA